MGGKWLRGSENVYEKEIESKYVHPAVMKTPGKLGYGLRISAGSISTWNARLNELVIRDIELTLPDCAHCCRAL